MLQENVDLKPEILLGLLYEVYPKMMVISFYFSMNQMNLVGSMPSSWDLDLAWSTYGSCLEVEASGIEVTPGLKLILECTASG